MSTFDTATKAASVVLGTACALLVGVMLITAVRSWWMIRNFKATCVSPPVQVPPKPPMTCPACASTDIEVVGSGLWDGVDRTTGGWIGGTVSHGICHRCKTRVAQWNDEPCYTPSDEEWKGWA